MEKLEKHINESTGLVYEFYARANIDPSQNKVTKDMEIWIYGHDRNNMSPHCHLLNNDIEIEVSLLDWTIVNVKRPKNVSPEWKNFTDFKERFFAWLKLPSKTGNANYVTLFNLWDHENEDSTISEFLKKHENVEISDELKKFLELRSKYLQNIYRQVIGQLFSVYYNEGKTFPFGHYKPLELLKILDIDLPIDNEDEEALQMVKDAEDFVCKTVF